MVSGISALFVCICAKCFPDRAISGKKVPTWYQPKTIMSDLVLDAQQLLDRSVMSECYDSVCNGEHLTDDIVSNIIVYVRHQLRSWTDSQDDTLRVKDNILLSLSTLLSAVKKKLCTSAVLLDAMKDADFSLIVSTYFCIAVWLHDSQN